MSRLFATITILILSSNNSLGQTGVSPCIGLFDGMDKDWLIANCTEFSTSSIESGSDHGFSNGKVGHYNLIFQGNSSIELIGNLWVRYFKKPWFQFSKDEVWFKISVVSPLFKIHNDLFVGQEMNLINAKYEFNVIADIYVYQSDCEIIELVQDENERVQSITITKHSE